MITADWRLAAPSDRDKNPLDQSRIKYMAESSSFMLKSIKLFRWFAYDTKFLPCRWEKAFEYWIRKAHFIYSQSALQSVQSLQELISKMQYQENI